MATIYYHYTNAQGAHGILSSRSLWLTDYRFLNDKHELRVALEKFLSHFSEELRRSFDWGFWWHDLLGHHCVLSLSRTPQILSQWRAYGGDATGMALGLNPKFLKHVGLRILNCKYEDHEAYAEELAQRHADLVHQVHEARRSQRRAERFQFWVAENRTLFDRIVHDLIALKNPAFVEEQEVRAVLSVPRGSTSLRFGHGLMIPYTAVDFWEDDEATKNDDLAVQEIWLGPRCSTLNMVALHSADLGPCKIRRYDCGYV